LKEIDKNVRGRKLQRRTKTKKCSSCRDPRHPDDVHECTSCGKTICIDCFEEHQKECLYTNFDEEI